MYSRKHGVYNDCALCREVRESNSVDTEMKEYGRNREKDNTNLTFVVK